MVEGRPPRPAWLRFLDQFRNLLVAVLLGAAVLAFVVTGELKDPVVIGVVVIANATLGFLQERRAERSLAALRGMLADTARVRRDGRIVELPVADLVADDVVLVQAGDRVPADGHWVVAHELQVDESALTGESEPAAKTTGPPPAADTPVGDRFTAGHMQSTVVRGRGEMVVTATGMRTEIGRIAALLDTTEPTPSPLQREVHDLARRLTALAGIAVALVFLIGLLRATPLEDNLVDAVALAVAAIPEGLPAVLTVTLAVGAHRLARHHAIVKRLAAVETLGCTTVVCSDKTGTLTTNRMTARFAWVDGERHPIAAAPAHLVRAATLCNDATFDGERVVGEPTEAALVQAAVDHGLDPDALRLAAPRVAEIPFDSARKFMMTAHDDGGDDIEDSTVLVCAKGAPDVLVEQCRLDHDERVAVAAAQAALAAEGHRVLAVATTRIARDHVDLDALARDGGLELTGLIALQDPPRDEARDAVAACHGAGIRMVMITGDHASTGAAIAGQLGMGGRVMTGAELDALDDDALVDAVTDVDVFARVAPEHKIRIVRALQARGEVVAMTGDGVNDAPALKGADIGIAMGVTGTEVAKEAADMVLTDDSVATIVRAVEGGRTIYANIVKFVRFQLTTNLAAITTILAATILAIPAGGGAFFAPLAILWVNLIMDGPPALALGVDPADQRVMSVPPRDPRKRILDTGRLVGMATVGAVMAAGTLAVYLLAAGGTGAVSEAVEAQARTMALTTFVAFQLFHLLCVRSETTTVWHAATLRNRKLWIAVAAVAALQVLLVAWGPLQQLMTGIDTTATLDAADWVLCLAVAVLVVPVTELQKWRRRRTATT
ncbi:MAG: cation-transporting P-type ATPase [Acidimicrobiia bacterium]